MSLPGDDYYCCQFQPNTFDPSRCGSCLRPGHMHPNTAPQNEDDYDFLSEVTVSCDVSDGWTYQESLVHTLSPDWELNICDTDTVHSSQDQWNYPETKGSISPEQHRVAQPSMTRLDSSTDRPSNGSCMEENRGRERSRRPSGSRGESGYFSPDRKGNDGSQKEGEPKRPYRHYERGHALPSNHSPEPKASIPFRNRNLGIPSQRRTSETFGQESWRSESPQRYTYHSNFRRGTESQGQGSPRSPSPRSPSPNRHRVREPSVSPQRRSSYSKSRAPSRAPSHARSHAPSHTPSHATSHTTSRHPSGRSSPSHRRGSVVSRRTSPSRNSSSYKQTDSSHLRNGDAEHFHNGRSRESRRPSHSSNCYSLDSEKLYKNLDSISRRGSSALQPNSYEGSQSSRPKTDINGSSNTCNRSSRDCSPPRSSYGTHTHSPKTESHSPQRETHSTRNTRPDTTQSYSQRATERPAKTDPSPPQGSWRGSSHSLLSPAPSRGSSPSRRGVDSQLLARSLKSHAAATMETDNRTTAVDRSRSNVRRGLEALLTSEPRRTHSSVDSQGSGGAGMTMEDYVILADIPRTGLEGSEGEVPPGQRRRAQSPSPRRDQRHRTPRYAEETDYSSRAECDERGRGRERGRDRREREREEVQGSEEGRLSRTQSTASLHTQSSDYLTGKGHRPSKTRERVLPEHTQIQPDLRNFKGWMSMLDENGEWRKHWFVLMDAGLRFYRDSEAEESDDLDGEIDLTSCVNVVDFDLETNYGFQIHTKTAAFTLSAATSRLRRNWVRVLRHGIQSRHSPDMTQQSDSNSEKGSSRFRPVTPGLPPSRPAGDDSRPIANSTSHHRHVDSANPDPDDEPSNLSSAGQREAGEGWDRDQAKRLEERNKWFESGIPFSEMGSRWDSMELKKGSIPVPVTQMDSDVNKKWAELERLSFRDMSALSLIGAQSNQPTSADSVNPCSKPVQTRALQREASSLRQQVECLRKERVAMGMEVDSPCGPGAPCGVRLEAMEAAHRRARQELQEKHTREMRELERERDGLLLDESQATAQAVEVLKKAHREELEREVEKARRLGGGSFLTDPSCRGQTSQADALHSELDGLSERYSQKCLELSRAEQSGRDRQTELSRRERETEQLRRENKELQARLTEEISRMRHFITGQGSGFVSPGNSERSPSELEMLLRAKENEVQYLQKEISCLRNEVQSLTKEKQSACDRYTEAYVELTGAKGYSEIEIGALREHLRLANAALQEGARDS